MVTISFFRGAFMTTISFFRVFLKLTDLIALLTFVFGFIDEVAIFSIFLSIRFAGMFYVIRRFLFFLSVCWCWRHASLHVFDYPTRGGTATGHHAATRHQDWWRFERHLHDHVHTKHETENCHYVSPKFFVAEGSFAVGKKIRKRKAGGNGSG